MRSIARLRAFDAWLFAPEDARRLAAVRIGLCSALALRFVDRYGAAAHGPASRFHPLTYMKLFAEMPSPDVVTTLRGIGIAAALLAAAGLALRTSLATALVCSLIMNGLLNSAGRVIVGDALLTLCLLVLLASAPASGEAWTLHRSRRTTRAGSHGAAVRYGWPIRTAMLTIALAYFFAGLQKWRYSGLAWVTSGNLRWILYGQAHPNGLALYIADRPLLAHAFAAGALLLETCFPLILFFPRLRWIFVPSVIAMHIGIRVALGLDYSAQWLTVAVVFVNWPAAFDRLQRALPRVAALREASP